MGFFEAVKSGFSNFVNFTGRARRSEYWYFWLFNTLVATLLALAGGDDDISTASSIYSLVIFLPMLAVTWRRLHDVGKSGALFLIPILCEVAVYISLAVFVASESAVALIILLLALLATLVLMIVLFVYLCKDGEPGANMYGPDPKGRGEAQTPPSYYQPPQQEQKTYAYEGDAAPVDEIEAVVSGKPMDSGKVSLFGDEEEGEVPANKSSKTFCPKCGALADSSQKFCTECGARLG